MRGFTVALTVIFVAVAHGQEDRHLFWLANAKHDHGFTLEEAAQAAGLPLIEARRLEEAGVIPESAWRGTAEVCKVLPYPGGRHPRIGFLDGAIDPMRGTKVSVFAPDGSGFVVVDVPEAIFSNLGLLFLAHTHIPTIWDEQGMQLADHNWKVGERGELTFTRRLPNGVSFGAKVTPTETGADMELWLENGSDAELTDLRTQVCVMLKGMPGLDAQTLENKRFEDGKAAALPMGNGKWRVETTWENTGRLWGNERVPCIHADPVLPDCEVGERQLTHGFVVFGLEISRENNAD